MERPWHRRYDPGVPVSHTYPAWTVPDLLAGSAARWPDAPALLFCGARLTFREVDDLSTRFALALRALGVRAGDRVAIMLPNLPQTVLVYFGVLKAGAVAVLTNPLYVARELELQVRDSGSETIVALDLFAPRIEEVRARTPLARVILTRVGDFLPPLRRWLYPLAAHAKGRWARPPRGPHIRYLTELLRAPGGTSGDAPRRDPDALALLQYTGGTTGTPKGAMLTHRQVVANAWQCRHWVPDLREGREVFLGVIPFFHVYGLSTCLHPAIMSGSCVVLLPRFRARDVLRAVHRHRVTIFSGVPAMFAAIVEDRALPRYDLRSLRVCLSGASPLPLEVRDRFERLAGVQIAEGYGLTEASPVTHCNPVYGPRPPGSIGVPFPDTEVRVVDLASGEKDVPEGEPGQLLVRGPQVMRGYWNNDAETRAVLSPDGWLRTGDVVRRDEAGFFYLLDRMKDMIKSRGENVYPREVEEILYRHPAVREAVVVGVPDDRLGEAVKAYVVPVEGASVWEAELIEHCRRHLARFKVPTRIEFRHELPRTAVGKVLRRVLKEEELRRQAPAASGQRAG